MMKISGWFGIFILFSWTKSVPQPAAKQCAFSIASPHLNNSVLIAEEKSTISLNFTISGDCSFPDDLLIMVSREEYDKHDQETVHRVEICAIWYSQSACTSHTRTVCSCPEPNKVYTLKKTVELADNTTWVWWTQPKITGEEKVTFIVADEPGSMTEPLTESSNDNSFSLLTRSGVAPDASLVTTLPNDAPVDPVPFLYGVDFMVVTSVGIIAFAAIVSVVSVSIVRIQKRSRDNEKRRLSKLVQHTTPQEEPAADHIDRHQDNNEEDRDSRFSQETNFYWEIRNDPPTPSPELPRPCVWPTLSDDYLRPTVSRGVVEGTDDPATMTPLYENSVLR